MTAVPTSDEDLEEDVLECDNDACVNARAELHELRIEKYVRNLDHILDLMDDRRMKELLLDDPEFSQNWSRLRDWLT